MVSWQTEIINEFPTEPLQITVVADPDGLLTDEKVQKAVNKSGYEIIVFDDPVKFRLDFEIRFRSLFDKGDPGGVTPVIKTASANLNHLPYDLASMARKLTFSLGRIFPNLDHRVVSILAKPTLDKLFEVQSRENPDSLGEKSTKDFILKHCYKIIPEILTSPADLLSLLIKFHTAKQRMPAPLIERLVESLREDGLFLEWPLEIIIANSNDFFGFLQERWPIFLDNLSKGDGLLVDDPSIIRELKYTGPVTLPFDDDFVRPLMDNLFQDGYLEPVPRDDLDRLQIQWVKYGISFDESKESIRRWESLLEKARTTLPEADSSYQAWMNFAFSWAEMKIAFHDGPDRRNDFSEMYRTMQTEMDGQFAQWIDGRYPNLHNLPPTPPVMVHHVPRAMLREYESSPDSRLALVVIDGMSLDQWTIIKRLLQTKTRNLSFQEESVFAWIPTITSISRQALFSGRPPLFFSSSITRSDKDTFHWVNFWLEHGLSEQNVAFEKGVDGDLARVEDACSNSRTKVLGLVVNKLDKIMHGSVLGMSGMHQAVGHWMSQGFLDSLLHTLINYGFTVSSHLITAIQSQKDAASPKKVSSQM